MQCTKCGAALLNTDQFCPRCGATAGNKPRPAPARASKALPTPAMNALVFLALVAICGLLYLVVNGISNAAMNRDSSRQAAFNQKITALCQSADSLPLTPGAAQKPVYGYIIDYREINDAIPQDTWDQRMTDYLNFDSFLGEGVTKRKPYTARSVLCVEMDDVLVHACSYDGGYSVIKYQQNFKAALIDVETGRLLGRQVFTGGLPGECSPAASSAEGSKVRKILQFEDAITEQDVLSWINNLKEE